MFVALQNNVDCNWILTCITGSPTLIFSSFATESNFDFVYIYDGDDSSAPQIGETLQGSTLPSDVTASGSALAVRLTADGSLVRAGFVASFTCLPPPSDPPPSDGGGYGTAPAPALNGTAPGGEGADCSTNADCSSGLFCAIECFTGVGCDENTVGQF